MSDITDNLQFEMERRVIVFHKDTSMPDGTQLGFDGDPNNVDPNNTDGEFLIYNCPQNTRYAESNGTQWYKKEKPNIWRQFSGGSEIDWTVDQNESAYIHYNNINKIDGGDF